MLEHYKMCTTNYVVSLSLPLLLLSGGGQCGPGEERQLVIHQTWSQEPAGYNRQLFSIVHGCILYVIQRIPKYFPKRLYHPYY